MTDSTENATTPNYTKQKNWDSSVQIQSGPSLQLEFVTQDSGESEFLDFGGVVFSLEIVIRRESHTHIYTNLLHTYVSTALLHYLIRHLYMIHHQRSLACASSLHKWSSWRVCCEHILPNHARLKTPQIVEGIADSRSWTSFQQFEGKIADKLPTIWTKRGSQIDR